MSSPNRLRGRRLPQRVYWTRRALVLVVAMVMVVGVAKLLGSGSGPVTATTSADHPARSTTPAGSVGPVRPPAATPTGTTKAGHKTGHKTGAPAVVLATPSGPCATASVSVTPTLATAAAGGQIDMTLSLTSTVAACTFAVSPQTVVLKVTSGSDRIWSSQDCPSAIPHQDVVVRSAVPAKIVVPWSGRRSDTGCHNGTGWATPGFYHATAAAIGSQPTDTLFRLTLPPRAVITRTAHPKPTKTPTGTPTTKPSAKPSSKPTGKPTGSVD